MLRYKKSNKSIHTMTSGRIEKWEFAAKVSESLRAKGVEILPADVGNILEETAEVIAQLFAEGKTVQVGNIGTLFPQVGTKGKQIAVSGVALIRAKELIRAMDRIELVEEDGRK